MITQIFKNYDYKTLKKTAQTEEKMAQAIFC